MRNSSLALVTISLLLAVSGTPSQATDGPRTQVLLDNLKTDDTPYNATRSAEDLVAMSGSLPVESIRLVEKTLESDDLQLRQYGAALLTQIYNKQGVPPRAWPEAFLKTVVEGLRADDIYWPWTFQNHRMFLNYLYFLEDGFPLSLVQSELQGNSRQSSFGAAILLAHHLQGTVQPDVARVLLEHLKDDDQLANGRAAFQALAELGRPTFEKITAQLKEVSDWQQAAYLQCLSAYFNSNWAAPDRFLDEWYMRAQQQGFAEVRLEVPALYLHPNAGGFLRTRETPSLLSRLLKAGRTLSKPHDKAVWLGTWFWYIKPRPTLLPHFAQKPFMRYSEFRLYDDGDYFIALEAIAGIGP